MKKRFIAGDYSIKIKGRGIIKRYLTANEVKVLFGLVNSLDMEYIELDDNTVKGDMTFVHTKITGIWGNNNDSKL